nr:Crp/Fnr family transcriptional regulator [Aurantimonas endophytica]
MIASHWLGGILVSNLSRGPLRLALPIPDDDLDALFDVFSQTIVVGKHAFLRREGDRSDLVRILQSGVAIRHKANRQGNRQIVGILMPGHICDLSSLFFDDPDHSIETVTDCAVAVARRDEVLALMDRRPVISRAFLARSLADASIAREWVMNVGRRTGYQRVAHLLCEIFACSRNLDFADTATCIFPLTQEELVDATGLTVVYVNRALQDLRRRELITLRQNLLTVHDWQGLCAEADFSHFYLHGDDHIWSQPGGKASLEDAGA